MLVAKRTVVHQELDNLSNLRLLADLRTIIDIYDFEAEIIAASIRNSAHVEAVAKLGAHIATIPDNLFEKMTQHPLTTNGIAQFMKDWEAFKK